MDPEICEPVLEVSCGDACKCVPQTATDYRMVNPKLKKDDTELRVHGIAPCCGFGMFEPCPEGQAEIFRIVSRVYDSSTNTSTLTIVRGLPFTGCDSDEGMQELIFEHYSNQKLTIGSTDIHYYYCQICKQLECIENEIRCYVETEEDLPEDGECGQRCIIWNGGFPILYVFDCEDGPGGGQGWTPVNCTTLISSDNSILVERDGCEWNLRIGWAIGTVQLPPPPYHEAFVPGTFTSGYTSAIANYNFLNPLTVPVLVRYVIHSSAGTKLPGSIDYYWGSQRLVINSNLPEMNSGAFSSTSTTTTQETERSLRPDSPLPREIRGGTSVEIQWVVQPGQTLAISMLADGNAIYPNAGTVLFWNDPSQARHYLNYIPLRS